jgi:hypothetical protein
VILLVTNSRDFATDLVVAELRKRDAAYLRLDLDLLSEDSVTLDVGGPSLSQRLPDGETRTVASPHAILFRAPTHLRESSGHRHTPEELLQLHQWAAFARSLTIFRDARWVNHPVPTYAAETKPYQLVVAASLGFAVPRTFVANSLPSPLSDQDTVAMKALDTFLVRQGDHDLFFYTTTVRPSDLTPSATRAMPVIFQTLIHPKTDVRVTVVGETCFAAETPGDVRGDWRLQKDEIQFRRATLSEDVRGKCVALTRALGLRFGAIDLVRSDGTDWFLEINPTGEWAWLEDLFDGEIARAIAEELLRT